VASIPTQDTHPQRLKFLDGLRGIAILLVLCFHAYARWTSLYPFHEDLSQILIFKYGWMGVNLFFIISGFVILMTLEKCANFQEFITRRWIRLFPAMLICSLVIFVTAIFLPQRPAGTPVVRDLLPGLTFIDPFLWSKILRSPQGELEGAFWSIFVEMKFYFFFGAAYFYWGAARAILTIVGMFVLWFGLHFIGGACLPRMGYAAYLLNVASGAQNFAWFAAGAFFYRGYASGNRQYWTAAVLCGVANSLAATNATPEGRWLAAGISLLFLLPLISSQVARALSLRPLVFAGFVSYPFYLMHENAVVAMTIQGTDLWPGLPTLLMPMPAAAVVLAVSWLVAAFGEPGVRRLLRGISRALPRRASPTP
jgi:peptidoglycan/LPS O-acetylase OafA/YrhL